MRIMQDEMLNKDTASKQQEKLNNLKKEIDLTDESIQTEQLLNLQLSNEYNRLLTNLSHILNQRNSLLLECEGLRNTVSLLNTQYQEIANSVDTTHRQKAHFDEQLQALATSMTELESASLQSRNQQRMEAICLLTSEISRREKTTT